MSVLFIGWISPYLLGFYLIYVAAIYTISHLILKAKMAKRIVFVCGALFCLAPLVLVRLLVDSPIILIVGLAFALLRGIDALFYTYYTEEKLKFLTFFNFMMFIPTFTAGPVFRYRDFQRACMKLVKIG